VEWSEEDQKASRAESLRFVIMEKIKLTFFITLIALVTACGSATKRSADVASGEEMPGWILNPPQQVNALYGVGSADVIGSLEQAQGRAREVAMANLMQQIQLDIAAQSQTRIEQREDNRDGYQFSQELRQEISMRVPEMRFSYMEQVKSHEDRKRQQVYVLMRLDVAQELSAAKNRAQQLEATIRDNAERAFTQGDNVLAKIQYNAKALLSFESHQQLHDFVMQLQPRGEGLPLSSELQLLQQRVIDRLSEVSVSISPLKGQAIDHTISQVLGEQLSKRGLRLTANIGALQLGYRLEQSNRYRDGSFFVSIEGVVELQDEKGAVMRSFKSSARGVSGAESEALRRALNKLGKRVADSVVEVLFDAS